jgi:hypothetical protein
MQTTFDAPFGARFTGASYDETLVVMRGVDGGLELLGDDVTLVLSPDGVRTLLFYGSTVDLEGTDGATAAIAVDPRKYAVVLLLEGRAYRAPRWAVTAVARGRLPAAYLRADRRPLAPGQQSLIPASRMADA